jgi:hypothetical protein
MRCRVGPNQGLIVCVTHVTHYSKPWWGAMGSCRRLETGVFFATEHRRRLPTVAQLTKLPHSDRIILVRIFDAHR